MLANNFENNILSAKNLLVHIRSVSHASRGGLRLWVERVPRNVDPASAGTRWRVRLQQVGELRVVEVRRRSSRAGRGTYMKIKCKIK